MTLPDTTGRGLPSAADPARPTTLIIGLGNPILGDDGVGWRAAERVQARLSAEGAAWPRVEVEFLSLGGLSLMERLVGFQNVIIIDSLITHQGSPGRITCFPLEALTEPAAGHTTSSHDTSLRTAIALGRWMGASLPEKITIVAVEIKPVYDFSERLSPEVAAAVPLAEQTVFDLILQGGLP